MARKNKNNAAGVVIGPILVLLAMATLWKNETRFDYHRAASRTRPTLLEEAPASNATFSYTGSMKPDLEIRGDYVETFLGQLVVYRSAEIYCWDRDEDDEGHVSWNMEWMSSVQSNSRNSGVRQELQSKTLLPPDYRVGDLPIRSSQIEFVDATHSLDPRSLTRTSVGQRLAPTDQYFFLRKHRGNQLGDERISYAAIQVPATATYFGKYVDGQGVADTTYERHGFISGLIQDTGILHHLVCGDRQQALATMKRHIRRLKWIVRGAGTLAIVVGFLFFFSGLLRFLFHIPIIGWFAEQGVFIISLAVGIPLAGITIGAGFLAGHPFLLGLVLVASAGAGYWGYRAFRMGRSEQMDMRDSLNQQLGHTMDDDELKEREYLEIAQLMGRQSGLGAQEQQVLDHWGRKQGWSPEKRNEMLQRTQTAETPSAVSEATTDENLQGLIRLAVADGALSAYEMRTIQSAAQQAGYSRQQVRALMKSARRTADLRANFLENNRNS